MYAQKKTERIPDHFSNGGKLDAYRHVFFMAAFAQKVKVKKLRKLGKAHEKGNYLQFKRFSLEDGEIPDSLGTVMDLHNNEIGLSLGASNKTLPLPELEKLALEEIAKGKALIMKRRSDGSYTDCSGSYTDLKLYIKTWNIPKCLVSSD
ncbi:MAG: hypothetical protein K0S12_1880, partial [Bacteroidetes bacterium]|nr:hypothetical protein [Bacteroidota bacterium]